MASLSECDRFLLSVDRSDPGGCWLWTGSRTVDGYGRFRLPSGYVRAHRYAYQLWAGPIPDGLTLDHLTDQGCTSTLCVRPDHLEAVTAAENLRRRHARERTLIGAAA